MILRLACLALCFVCAGAGPMQTDEYDIYLLMGQSNMSGRGELTELLPFEREASSRIKLFGNDGRWRNATEPLDSPAGQRDPVSADPDAAVGPGLFFAHAMRRGDDRLGIALVPCAKGGTSMVDWRPDPSRDRLYGSCLARAREASARGRIAGVLWYQGETDAADSAAASQWAERATDMLSQLRRDLGAPTLPVVIVSLADPPETGPYASRFPASDEVRRQQEAIDLPGLMRVSAAGLPRNPDRLHLSTAAQRILGRRMAAAVITQLPQ